MPLPAAGIAKRAHELVVDLQPTRRDDQPAVALIQRLLGERLDAQARTVSVTSTSPGRRTTSSRIRGPRVPDPVGIASSISTGMSSSDARRDDRALRAVWRELRKPRNLLRYLRKSGDLTIPVLFAGPTLVVLAYWPTSRSRGRDSPVGATDVGRDHWWE
jgi:hypothetical protein